MSIDWDNLEIIHTLGDTSSDVKPGDKVKCISDYENNWGGCDPINGSLTGDGMKPTRYITALIITIAFVLTLFSAQKAAKQVKTLSEQLTDLKTNFEAQDRAYAELQEKERLQKEIVESLEQTISDLQQEQKALQAELEGKMSLPLSEYPAKTNRGGDRFNKRTMLVTAYDLSYESCGKLPSHPLYGITASGERVREWYTAAAGPELPIGTIIYIPSFRDYPNGGVFVIKDRGGAIDNGDIDIYMSSEKACHEHGAKRLTVYVLGEEG